MTLVLALKWLSEPESLGEAVLVVSDSKATSSAGIAFEVKKICRIELNGEPVAIASGAGSAPLAKWGFEEAKDVLLTYARKECPVSFSTFRKAVREIESRFVKRLSELEKLGSDASFEMILCGLDISGKASMYRFDGRGLAEPVHDDPGYAVLGTGLQTGGILLLKLLDYSTKMNDLGTLTAFIIDTVSEVDTAVGPFIGESYLMRIEDQKGKRFMVSAALNDEAVTRYKNRSATRKVLIRNLWQLCDNFAKENIEQKIEQALESLQNSLTEASEKTEKQAKPRLCHSVLPSHG